jgi:hypothetical protein
VAMSVNCAMAAMAIMSAIILRFILVRLNKKLDQVCSLTIDHFHPRSVSKWFIHHGSTY